MRNRELIQLCAGRYYQGQNVISKLGQEALCLGKRALIVADTGVWDKVKEKICKNLDKAEVSYWVYLFSGHCCPSNYNNAAKLGIDNNAELVIGVGGGRALDTAKVTSDKLEIRDINIPTSAATCACSAWLSVEYTDEGAFVGNYWTKYPPFAVIADTDFLVSDCPLRYNAAGIVDAMAKYPEICYNTKHPVVWEQNFFSHVAKEMAGETYNFFKTNGEKVVQQLSEGQGSQLVEDSICAALQMTGIISALACGGKQAAVSHVLYSYFCCNHPSIAKKYLHGELVGASLIYQHTVNGRQNDIAQLHRFLRTMDMPTCLTELGLSYSNDVADELFDFLRINLPVESDNELKRLRSYEDILFNGIFNL